MALPSVNGEGGAPAGGAGAALAAGGPLAAVDSPPEAPAGAPWATLALDSAADFAAGVAAGDAGGGAGVAAVAAGGAFDGVGPACCAARAPVSMTAAAAANPSPASFKVLHMSFSSAAAPARQRRRIVHYGCVPAFYASALMSRFPEARFLVSAASSAQFPPDVGSEVAFVGRSNAGKSSAINAVVHRQGLARTSKTPGRTRLVNFFELGAGRRLVDLPGYGYASGPEAERRAWAPLIDALPRRASLRGLFVIVDARRGITPRDLGLLEWASPGQRLHVLLSKADKLNRSDGARAARSAAAQLEGRATVQLFSARSGEGVEEAQLRLVGWLGLEPALPEGRQ